MLVRRRGLGLEQVFMGAYRRFLEQMLLRGGGFRREQMRVRRRGGFFEKLMLRRGVRLLQKMLLRGATRSDGCSSSGFLNLASKGRHRIRGVGPSPPKPLEKSVMSADP